MLHSYNGFKYIVEICVLFSEYSLFLRGLLLTVAISYTIIERQPKPFLFSAKTAGYKCLHAKLPLIHANGHR